MNDILACISSIPDTRGRGGGSYSQRNSVNGPNSEVGLYRKKELINKNTLESCDIILLVKY